MTRSSSNEVVLDFPECIRRAYPEEFPAAWQVVEEFEGLVHRFDPSRLEDHHPGLRFFDWETYLRCSVVRMVKVAAHLKKAGCSTGRVLEYGSWFGNFALLAKRTGYSVDVIDSYRSYAPAFDEMLTKLGAAGIEILDFDEYGYDLEQLEDGTYDAVLCLGVIEHIPHTPRVALEALDRVLKPGGVLVLDTPNLAYLYNRERLQRGESVFPSIWHQYFSLTPFHGHHREYTLDEVEWMLEQLEHDLLVTDLFNYSLYSNSAPLRGRAHENYLRMEDEPNAREYILTLSRSTRTGVAPTPPDHPTDPADEFAGGELPPGVQIQKLNEFVRREREKSAQLVEEIDVRDTEIQRRDKLLQDVQQQVQDLLRETAKRDAEIERRDGLLQSLQSQINGLITQIQAREKEVQKRDHLLQEVQGQVQDSLVEIGKRESEITRRDDLLQGAQQQIDDLMAKLRTRERAAVQRQIDGLRTKISQRYRKARGIESSLAHLREQAEASMKEVGDFEVEIERRDGLLKEAQKQIDRLFAQSQTSSVEIQKRDEMLRELQQQVQDTLEEVGIRDNEIVKRDLLLEESQRRIEELLAAAAKRDEEIGIRDTLLGDVQRQVQDSLREIAKRDEMLAEALQANRQLEQRLLEITVDLSAGESNEEPENPAEAENPKRESDDPCADS